MFGFVGFGNVYCGTTDERVWHKKSFGCKSCYIIHTSFKRIFIACDDGACNCFTTCMACDEQLVTRLCLQDYYLVVDVCNCWFNINYYCPDNSKFPGY